MGVGCVCVGGGLQDFCNPPRRLLACPTRLREAWHKAADESGPMRALRSRTDLLSTVALIDARRMGRRRATGGNVTRSRRRCATPSTCCCSAAP